MSGEFTIDRGLRQGDVLSTQLFNIALQKIMRSTEIKREERYSVDHCST
jgi:hypothetical protein